jgi:hypothetical protein
MKTYLVVTDNSTPQYAVQADRMHIGEGGALAFYVNDNPEPVASFPGHVSVTLEPAPVSAKPLSAAEPACSLGVASYFSSPASPLVEAIESTVRLVAELEVVDHRTSRPDHLTALGFMTRHLEALLAEQRAHLCAPVPMMRPA